MLAGPGLRMPDRVGAMLLVTLLLAVPGTVSAQRPDGSAPPAHATTLRSHARSPCVLRESLPRYHGRNACRRLQRRADGRARQGGAVARRDARVTLGDYDRAIGDLEAVAREGSDLWDNMRHATLRVSWRRCGRGLGCEASCGACSSGG